MVNIVFIFIAVLAGVAVIYDFKTFRIPNRLNLCAGLCGVLYCSILHGISDGILSLMWAVITMAVLFGLYAGSVLGAGDVKLYAAIGAFVHRGIIWIVILSFLVAAIYGLCITLIKKRNVFRSRTQIHMSLPIFVGILLWGLLQLLGV